MDKFPLLAANASRRVEAITVIRRVNTADRRLPLVEKSGRGLTEDEFLAGLAAGRLGKRGLIGSVKLLAHGLQWDSHDVKDDVEPILVDGIVTGYRHLVRLRSDGREINLDLTMDWNLADPHDEIIIDGEPPLHIRIEGGYHGDRGTTTQLVNALRHCGELEPAFYRPIDLPLRIG
jgi:4-hydroxy-tetrahydrodipicolinate reductase